MSLVAFALRACAVRVIRSAVASSFIVLDSPVDAISVLQDSRQTDGSFQGVISVYTGTGANEIEGLGFFAGNPTCEMFIQILLPSQVTLQSVPGSSLALNSRKGGAELALDLTERAILRALAVQADTWSQLFGRLVSGFRKTERQSYLVETSSVRTPGRNIFALAAALQEPTPGAPPTSFWSDFIAAMGKDADLAPLAGWVSAELASPAGLSQAEIDRIFLGVTEEASQDIGVTTTQVFTPPLPTALQADTVTVSTQDVLDGAVPE